MRLFVSLLLTCILCIPALASADALTEGLVEATGMGTVDSAKARNKIQAKLLAKRAAIVDAQRNLLEMIEGVRVTSGTTVKDAQLESDLIANRVKGLLKGAFTTNENIIEDGGEFLAEVTLGVCINASLTQCSARPKLSQIIYESLDKPAEEEKFQAEPDPSASGVSGLIVDTSNVEFSPYFDVRLVASDGKEVYGPGHFDVQSGGDWLNWADSLDIAKGNTSVVGDSPLVVTASSLTGESNIMLSDEDAIRVFQANLQNGDFLREGKVILVVQ